MDIFTSLPNAVISDVWELGQISRSTEVGKSYEALRFLTCIADEEATGDQNNSPSADGIESGTLLFVKPADLAPYNIDELIASFMVKNTQTGQLYMIKNVGLGKNQETGMVEHIELLIEPTEVLENE